MNLKSLNQFIPSYKWRIQSVSKKVAAASCVAYIDARDVMAILDEVVGAENWQSDYKEIKGNLYAGIAIKINGNWIWKWDCGTETNTEREKGEASDSFKRAAVKWGVGRFLYELPIQYVKTNEAKKNDNNPYPIDERGNRIYNLTTHINKNTELNKKIASILYFPGAEEKIKPKTFDENTITEAINKIRKTKTKENLEEIKNEYLGMENISKEFKKAIYDRTELLK